MLNEIEVRILGCLIEKEITTPDYYPLTLNSLTNACNQKSNRFPLVAYDEAIVEKGLVELREKGIAQFINTPGSRTIKYRHSFPEKFSLIPSEEAVLCELMLRGPQTVGEIRVHAERMYAFKGLEEVDEILKDLMERDGPLIVRLQRQTGKKEARYMHLLSGMPEIQEKEQSGVYEKKCLPNQDNERLDKLEKEVSQLRDDLDELKKTFDKFRTQFD